MDINKIRIAVKPVTDHIPLHIPGYRQLENVGKGQTGVLYRALSEEGGERVMVKVTHPFFSIYPGDPFHIERLGRAMTQVARLDHPNIVRVLEHGSLSLRPDKTVDRFFVIAPLIDGWSLRRALNDPSCPLLRGVDDVLTIMTQLVQALHHAHEHGVLHNNLKPENVFLSRDQDNQLRVLVNDFAIAGIVRVSNGPLDGEREHGFLAPEVLNGHVPDERSDQYALGVLLMQILLTLTRSYGARFDRLMSIAERCMNPDPDQRFQDTRALQLLLMDLQRNTAPPELFAPPPSISQLPAPTPAETAPTARALTLPLIGLAAAILLMVGIGPQLLRSPPDVTAQPLQQSLQLNALPTPPVNDAPSVNDAPPSAPILSDEMRALARPLPTQPTIDLGPPPASTTAVTDAPVTPTVKSSPKSSPRPSPRPAVTPAATPKPPRAAQQSTRPVASVRPATSPAPVAPPPSEPVAPPAPLEEPDAPAVEPEAPKHDAPLADTATAPPPDPTPPSGSKPGSTSVTDGESAGSSNGK
ncbi:MAG: protein kinase [Myxococcota bacterium]